MSDPTSGVVTIEYGEVTIALGRLAQIWGRPSRR